MYIDNLILEVTRRCNMSCMHCLRGKAQNKDMTKEMVDIIFEDITSLTSITFTGGEPFLNIDIIEYVLEVVKKKNINVCSFYVATNGKEFNPRYISVMNEWAYYVAECNYGGCSMKTLRNESMDDILSYSGLSVSIDKYHEAIPIENYLKYRMLSYYSDIKEQDNINVLNEGSAKENGIGHSTRIIEDVYVEVDDSSICVYSTLYISAIGTVLGDCDSSYDNQESLSIGNIFENPLSKILIDYYNEKTETA